MATAAFVFMAIFASDQGGVCWKRARSFSLKKAPAAWVWTPYISLRRSPTLLA